MPQAVVLPQAILLIEESPKPSSAVSLQNACKNLLHVRNEKQASELLPASELAVICTPAARMIHYQALIASSRKIPIFWYTSPIEKMPRDTEWGHSLDGLLFPSMSSAELDHAIKWGIRCYHQRKHWNEEREQLLQRLEERKWVDQAKSILCEIKGITESEAYDFLRKEAMNERKRIGDIAANIVKVYQLIHG